MKNENTNTGMIEIEYQNTLNDIPFKKFTEADYNLFFAIIFLAKQGVDSGRIEKDPATNKALITLEYSDIKKLSGLGKSRIKNSDFNEKYLKGMIAKLQAINGTIKNGNIEDDIVLFPKFRRNTEDALLTVFLEEDFFKVLYEFDELGFTKIEFKRLVTLESKYTKTLYRKLCQFKRTGKYQVKADTFRELFDIPESYKQSDIMKRVINPAIEELSNEFKNLSCELHHAPKRGAPVDRYTFTFVKSVREQRKTTEGQSDMDQAAEEMAKYKKQKQREKNAFNRFEESPDTPKNKQEWSDLENLLLDN